MRPSRFEARSLRADRHLRHKTRWRDRLSTSRSRPHRPPALEQRFTTCSLEPPESRQRSSDLLAADAVDAETVDSRIGPLEFTHSFADGYVLPFIDLAEGPWVVVMPEADVRGAAHDMWQMAIVRLAEPGRCLFVGPGQDVPEGAEAAGYEVARSPSMNLRVVIRLMEAGFSGSEVGSSRHREGSVRLGAPGKQGGRLDPNWCSKAMRLGAILLVMLAVYPSWAADGGEDDLRAKTQNPVGSLISVPFENNVDFGAPNGSAYILNFQPVVPVTVGDWNLISRPILPIAYVPGFVDGLPGIPSGAVGDGTFGLGDLNYSLFLSPAAAGSLIWGFGPSITFPTATDAQLGSGKWSAGLTGVVLAQPKPWSVGILVRQLWSVGGDDNRETVSQFLIQPFVNYNFDGGWFLFSDPIITANWNAGSGQTWTLPLGGGVGRLFRIGDQPINTRLGAFGNVVRPDFAPTWALKFTVQLLFPK